MVDTLHELKKAVLEGDDERARTLTQKALNDGAQALDVMNTAVVAGIQEAGQLWKENVYFMSDMVMSVEAFRVAMELIEPHLPTKELEASGKVVIGTVAGDIHDLGKMLVIAMLRATGFNVINLGEDVSCQNFIDKVKELKPDILGLGCYMTTTMLEMKEVIKRLRDSRLRNSVKVMIGGVPTTQEYANEIGADAWGKDALDAVEKAKRLMKERQNDQRET